MKLHFINIIFLFIAFQSFYTLAYAGGTTGMGRGGNAVVCYNQPVFRDGTPVYSDRGPVVRTRIQLFDYWESESPIKLSMGPVQTDYMEMARFVLKRIGNFEIDRSVELLKRLRTFPRDASMVDLKKEDMIRDFWDDTDSLPDENCYITQFAIQHFNSDRGISNFLIDKDLFEHADNATKAGLILHELLYEEALAQARYTPSDGSEHIRRMNRDISSDFMETADRLDYYNSVPYKSSQAYLINQAVSEIDSLNVIKGIEDIETQGDWITFRGNSISEPSNTFVKIRTVDLFRFDPVHLHTDYGYIIRGRGIFSLGDDDFRIEGASFWYEPLVPGTQQITTGKLQGYMISGVMSFYNGRLMCSDDKTKNCTVGQELPLRHLKLGESIEIDPRPLRP